MMMLALGRSVVLLHDRLWLRVILVWLRLLIRGPRVTIWRLLLLVDLGLGVGVLGADGK